VRKVGHAGTLDPAATGLLILLAGKATRSQADFMGLDKEYSAQILLGVETTTWDMDGEVIEKKAVPLIERTDLEALIADRFSGEIDQIPPSFSAVKQQGVPSYRRARQGQPVNLEPRKVRVFEIEIQDWTSPEITLRVSCSSGFYVRSLAHDVGAAIGCGGTLKQLVRTRIGPHHLKEALSLDELAVKLSQSCDNHGRHLRRGASGTSEDSGSFKQRSRRNPGQDGGDFRTSSAECNAPPAWYRPHPHQYTGEGSDPAFNRDRPGLYPPLYERSGQGQRRRIFNGDIDRRAEYREVGGGVQSFFRPESQR